MARKKAVTVTTANEQFRDALIRHQIGILRLSSKLQKDVIAAIDATERELALELRALDPITDQGGADIRTRRARKRLTDIQKRLARVRSAAFGDSLALWDQTLRDFVVDEAKFLDVALEAALPVVYDAAIPDFRRLRSTAVTNALFRGPGPGMHTLQQWVRRMERADLDRIMGQIRIGLVEGSNVPAITRRVVGTARLKGTDGVTAATRREATMFTRTALNQVANEAKKQFYVENEDVISFERYTATLDSRTTPVCMGLDGQRFRVGEGPYPPVHINCRSLRIAVVGAEVLAERPMKTVTQQMLLREYREANGLTRAATADRASLPRGHKSKFDQFARKRTRDLIGRVPADTTYEQFLRAQPASFQDDVLGKTKGKLFREGKLPIRKFTDETGAEYTLSELARRDRKAFLDAGLKPKDFIKSDAA